jgi:hypothetical protein
MASGPENRFIRSLNTKLPKEVYAEKMHNPYRGGTFDCWYSGRSGDLWVEYKWIPSVPKTAFVVPELSPLQRMWGSGRFGEGRKVRVIVGCPDGGVIFDTPYMWEGGLSAADFRKRILTKPAIVAWLVKETTGIATNDGNTTSRKRSKRK